MKKIIPIVLLFISFIGLAIYISIDNAKTDTQINKTWSLENKVIENITIYGTEQPVLLKIKETNNATTKITVSGKVSKSSVDMLEKSEVTNAKVYIPLSQRGFKLITTSSGKSELTITIELGRNVSFNNISLNTLVGEITAVVPMTYDGRYSVTLNSGAKLLEVPVTTQSSQSNIIIDAYSNVRILKGE